MIRSSIAVVAVSLVLGSPVFAGTAQTRDTEALMKADQALAQQEKEAARACLANSGSPSKTIQTAALRCSGRAAAHREEVQQQRRQVEALLGQLEAGRPVDPSAVDRVLRDAGQSY